MEKRIVLISSEENEDVKIALRKLSNNLVDELTREIWNKLIAEPKNEKGKFEVSPGKLRSIIESVVNH